MKNLLFQRFLENSEEVRRYYGRDFRDETARREGAHNAAARSASPALVTALKRYSERLFPSAKRDKQIEALADPETVVIVTGQQAGLFLGPSFTIYKVLSALAVSRMIERETGRQAVCVYWLQSEDHDYGEIRTTYVPTEQYEIAEIGIDPVDGEHSRSSIAFRTLGPSVNRCFALLEKHLSRFPHSEQYLSLFKRYYTAQTTLADAFAGTISELFSEEGLVIFDPSDPAISDLKMPVFSEALARWREIAASLTSQVALLREAGYAEQIHVREDSPLFFYHPHGASSPRYRLQHTATGWRLIGGNEEFSHDTIEQILRDHPERFSTSALLRPILQDSLFPTAAYVAGPSEIAYFAELTPVYDLFSLPYPTLFPRARFRIIEPAARKLLGELKLTPDDLSLPEDALLKKLAASDLSAGERADKLGEQVFADVSQALEPFRVSFTRLDPTLVQALEKAEKKILHQISSLQARHLRALSTRDGVTRDRLRRLKSMLVPNYIEQERVYGAPYFLCRYGEEFFNLLQTEIDIFTTKERDLTL